jgi:hypothetical protein
MNKFVISPEKAAELQRLNRDLIIAQERVATAFQTRGRPFEGPALAQLMDDERKLRAIARRIRELKGE